MPTQKVFKQRVRARMEKTEESYAAARHQLLSGATGSAEENPEPGPGAAPMPATAAAPRSVHFAVSDDALVRATGRPHADWFADLDAWDAASRGHTAIAAWLMQEHAVGAWWAQSITVAYERARGIRAQHQATDGFEVSANRTVGADAARVLAAFTDPALRATWLPDAVLTARRTTAAGVARFDWADPPSRLAVRVTPKGESRATVSVVHEKLPDAIAADGMKAFWRARLDSLRELLDGSSRT